MPILVPGPAQAGLRGAARDLGALRLGGLRVRRELLLPVHGDHLHELVAE